MEYITDEVFSKLSDYDADKTKYHLEKMLQKNYKPVTCETLQHKNLCPGKCAAIGHNKSPIAFFFRQKGMKTGQREIKARSLWDNLDRVNHSYYETIPGSTELEEISNFTMDLYEQLHLVDGIDDIDGKTIIRGHIIDMHGSHDIEMDARKFSSDSDLRAEIYTALGNAGVYMKDVTKVRLASNKYSKQNKIKILKVFGYNEDFTKYYTPTVAISADVIKPNDELIIDLNDEPIARQLDLKIIDEATLSDVKEHVDDVLLKLSSDEITHAMFAHTMLPIIDPFVDPGDKSRFTLFIRGQSGTGKSFVGRALQNFYGSFPDEVATWGSTPYSLQRLGYYFKDALFLIDDFKKGNITGKMGMVLQVLQNYADNTTRGRLNSSGQASAESRVIKGSMMITGEDNIEGEASNLARMITLQFPVTRADLVAGEKIKKMRKHYSGLTAHYVKHIMGIDKDSISDKRAEYQLYFNELLGKTSHANQVRISRNIAVLMTSYYYLAHFMWDKKIAEKNITALINYLGRLSEEIAEAATAERSAEQFVNYLDEFIAAGKLRIVPETPALDLGTDNYRGATPVGFVSGGKTYLIKNLAFNEIQKLLKQSGTELTHSATSIFDDLEKDKRIASARTVPKRFNGKNVRVVELLGQSLPNITDEELK